MNLQAPTPDPTGYTFEHWVVNNTTKTAGLRSITFTMSPAAAGTATAVYKANTGTLGAQPVLPTGSSARSITDPAAAGTLTVQSAPPTGLSISSTTGDGGTTNYTLSSVAQGTSVDLQAPETDPAGYSFLQWTVDGVAQTAGQKAVTFTMTAAATAVAQYTPSRCALAVQSAPPTGVVITSSTADGGLTNYAASGVEYGTSVTLQAPATDPVGYTFLEWTVNGVAQTAGRKSIAFTVSAAATAVAQYTANTYTLTVQSTAANGIVIASNTGDGGTTNYSAPGIAYGTIVNLAAPATDPVGYTFSQWTLNGTAADRRAAVHRVRGLRRHEVHHVRDVRWHNGGGAIHAERARAVTARSTVVDCEVRRRHFRARRYSLWRACRRASGRIRQRLPAPRRAVRRGFFSSIRMMNRWRSAGQVRAEVGDGRRRAR